MSICFSSDQWVSRSRDREGPASASIISSNAAGRNVVLMVGLDWQGLGVGVLGEVGFNIVIAY